MSDRKPVTPGQAGFARGNERLGGLLADPQLAADVYVITCPDPRTDPSAFLELRLGDAVVVRNVGGRVSPDVLTDLAYIGYLSRTVIPGGPQFEVAVIYHN